MKYFHVRNHVLWLVLATLAMVGAMVNSFHIGRTLTVRYAPLVGATIEITLKVTTAHLWFEKIIGGDRSLSVANVLDNLDSADKFSHAMLEGGETRLGTFRPLEDPLLRQELEKTIRNISIFREIAEERWRGGAQSGAGSEFGQHFDQVFNDFLISTADIETTLQGKINGQLKTFDVLQILLIVVTLTFGVFAGMLLRRNQKIIVNSEKKYRDIFNNSISAIYLFDAGKNVIDSNQAGLDLLGYSREELLGMNIEGMDVDREAVAPAHSKLLSGQPIVNFEHQLKRKDGVIISVLNNSIPFMDDQENVIGMQSILFDITDRKLAQMQLEKSQHRFRDYAEMSADWFWEMDEHLRFTSFSTGMSRIAGLDEKLYIGKTKRELTADTDADDPRIKGYLDDLDAHRGFENFVYSYKNPRKEKRYASVTGIPLFDGQGIFTGYRGTTSDITERMRAEAELLASRAQLSLIFESVYDIIFVIEVAPHADFRFAMVNPMFLKVTGLSEDQVIGRRIQDVIPEPALAFVLESYREAIHTGKPVQWEETSDYPAGTKTGHVTISPVFDANNTCVQLTGTVHDITDRKLAEEALRESEERYARAVAGTNEGLWDWDIITGEDYFSPRWEAMLGYQEGESRPDVQTFFEMIHPDDLERAKKAIKAHLEDRALYDIELRLRCKNGSYKWIQSRGQAVWDEQGEATQMAGSIADITERKQLDQRLLDAKEEAENANRAKSEFLAAMSHDLRTPLNAIMGFSDMMRTKAFGPLGDAHYEDYAKDIYNSGLLLVSLINDILDLSKIEAGKYDLTATPVEISLLVQTCFHQLETMAGASSQILTTNAPSGMPALLGDERALIQILNNLLSNAIKFTPSGGKITVTSRVDDNNGIVLSVTDTGIGMSEEDIGKVLIPFEQVDGALSRRQKGTGLGLYICVNIMKLFGGALDIESKVDVGTTITLHFPPERTLLQN